LSHPVPFPIPRPLPSTLFPYTTLFRSHDRAADPSDTAIGGGATDEAGRDDVELEAQPRLRRRGVEPRGEDQAGQRRQHAHVDEGDRKSTRLNSSHLVISYAVFCLKKKK